MKILGKDGETFQILAFPSEVQINKGDYFIAEEDSRQLLLQAIDVSYANTPGILEDLLRSMSLDRVDNFYANDPLGVSSVTVLVKEARLVTAKLRTVVENGDIKTQSSWLPSRFNSKIYSAPITHLRGLMKFEDKHGIFLGYMRESPFGIDAEKLDGRLSIITGKKETGKSHVAKLIALGLSQHGCKIVVFDMNGEYINLDKRKDGSRRSHRPNVAVLRPGIDFRISPHSAGLGVMFDVLEHVYETPVSSLREFARAWRNLESADKVVTVQKLIWHVSKLQMHESVRDALLSRLNSLASSGLFAERELPIEIEDLLNGESGVILVFDMKELFPASRRVIVELVLSKLAILLRNENIPPVFLLAEEAHLYLRNTYWDDIVTRMRHYGLFPIFVTNQPDTIPEGIYRQADNIFLFNFTNARDLEAIARSSRIDSETVHRIVPQLAPHYCVIFGHVVNDFPVLVRIRDLEVQTMGQTKHFFRSDSDSVVSPQS